MEGRPLRRTLGWAPYEVVLDASTAARVAFGGAAWAERARAHARRERAVETTDLCST